MVDDIIYVFEHTTSPDGQPPHSLPTSPLDSTVYAVLRHTHRVSQARSDVTLDEREQVIRLCSGAGQQVIQTTLGKSWSRVRQEARQYVSEAYRLGRTPAWLAQDQAREAAVMSGQGHQWREDAARALVYAGFALEDAADAINGQQNITAQPAESLKRLTRRQLALLCAIRQVEGLDRWAWSSYIQLPEIRWCRSIVHALRGPRRVRRLDSQLQVDVYNTYVSLISLFSCNLLDIIRRTLGDAITGPESGPVAMRSDMLLCYLFDEMETILLLKQRGVHLSMSGRHLSSD
jgi:hypothetical protein